MQKQNPQLLIFDFDGCLYPFPENFIEILDTANGQSGHEISRGEWPHDIAAKRSLESYLNQGFAFKRAAEEYDICLHEASIIHHRNIDFDLKRDEDLIAAFKDINRSLVFPMILTQGSRCNVDRHLPKIGIENEIARNMRISVDEHGYDRLKSNSEYPWLFAKWRAEHVSGLQFADKDIHVFEDSPKNLVIPDQLGWNTVFVHHASPMETLPSHIHRQIRTTADILREMPQRHRRTVNHLTQTPDLG